jgi:hypothetical protein
MNRNPAEGAKDLWKDAVTLFDDKDLAADTAQSAAINRMLHLSTGTTERLCATDWGAIAAFPEDKFNDEELMHHFGLTVKQMLGGEFLIEKTCREKVQPILVRIGAACDHAQHNTGPIPYLFGLKCPIDVERKKKDGRILPSKASAWKSPLLSDESEDTPFEIEVDSRFPFVLNRKDATQLQVRYRFREQLTVHLLNHASSHQVRPGIVRL